MRRWHEERRIEPRFTPGLDHGSKGIILAEVRRGNEVHRRLVWFEGHKTPVCGIRGFGHVYRPAQLSVIDGRGYSCGLGGVFKGGRLSRARLAEHAADIARLMGADIVGDIDLARTLVAVDDAP